MKEEDPRTRTIIGCAMKVHRELGPGFLESVYHKSLALEISVAGLRVESEVPIDVYYRETLVGQFSADLFIERELILEIKAVQALVKRHEVQLVNYLTATRKEIGLLLNFGADSLEFRRKFRSPPPNPPPPSSSTNLENLVILSKKI